MPGLSSLHSTGRRLVLRNHRAGPVEAVDQRGRNGLVPVGEPNAVSDRQIGAGGQLIESFRTIEGRTIFGLHEPTGRSETEDVEFVLDTTADEPAVASE